MTETETIGAATAPKRRRGARTVADTAESSTPKRTGRVRRTAPEQPSSTAGAPASPTRSSRARTRRAVATAPADLTPPAPGPDASEPSAVDPVAPSSGVEAEPSPGVQVAAGEGQAPADPGSPAEAFQDAPGLPAAAAHTGPEHASPDRRTDFPPTEEEVVRHPVSRSHPARPTFKQSVLRAAVERFRGDRVREPVTADQVDELLVLLHKPGQSRSLKDATYDFLRRGMSKRHAQVQIEKLRGTYAPADERAAA
jgi:hypothetical protein